MCSDFKYFDGNRQFWCHAFVIKSTNNGDENSNIRANIWLVAIYSVCKEIKAMDEVNIKNL